MYIDTLTKIQNAQRARKETVRVPFTNMNAAILDLLVKERYLKEVTRKGRGPKRTLIVTLPPEAAFERITIVSKPSRRVYRPYKELRPVRSGIGITVLSTPQGVMADNGARHRKVGGEVLFTIW
ncbi:MAG: 30S ribosomal protein S8 [Candidatus Liptonbacteria bacterium]|nr:30S ribosomal protein S8 [Candidatus Liptonbacteria bacterium]